MQLRADGLSIEIHEQEVTEDKRMTQPGLWLANVDPAPVFPVFSVIQVTVTQSMLLLPLKLEEENIARSYGGM